MKVFTLQDKHGLTYEFDHGSDNQVLFAQVNDDGGDCYWRAIGFISLVSQQNDRVLLKVHSDLDPSRFKWRVFRVISTREPVTA